MDSKKNASQVRDIRQSTFYWIDNRVIDTYMESIGWKGLIVYNALCRHANQATSTCDPSIPTLARELFISSDTVKDGLRLLAQCGLITVQHRRHKDDSSRYTSNLYTLCNVVGGLPQHPGVGADSTQGGLPQHPGVGADSTGNKTHMNKTHLTRGDGAGAPALETPGDIFQIVQRITGLDAQNGNRKAISDLWESLRRPPVAAFELFERWWRGNWRSKEGDLPSLKQIKSCWPSAQKAAPTASYTPDKDDDIGDL